MRNGDVPELCLFTRGYMLMLPRSSPTCLWMTADVLAWRRLWTEDWKPDRKGTH